MYTWRSITNSDDDVASHYYSVHQRFHVIGHVVRNSEQGHQHFPSASDLSRLPVTATSSHGKAEPRYGRAQPVLHITGPMYLLAWRCLTKSHAIGTYPMFNHAPRYEDVRGRRGIAPRILKLSTIWRSVVSFTLRPLYTQGKSSLYALARRLCGQCRRGGEGKKIPSMTLPGNEPPSSTV
jgi:hypothetical protein